jgi:hypothetical protein
MSTSPSFDEAFAPLQRAGWSVDEARLADGSWVVTGSKGDERLQVSGPTQAEARARACAAAEGRPQPAADSADRSRVERAGSCWLVLLAAAWTGLHLAVGGWLVGKYWAWFHEYLADGSFPPWLGGLVNALGFLAASATGPWWVVLFLSFLRARWDVEHAVVVGLGCLIWIALLGCAFLTVSPYAFAAR